MDRRHFFQIMSGAAVAGALPFSLSRAEEIAANPGAYPASERSAVQQNGQTKVAPLDASDIRFTQSKKGDIVYAFVMGWPTGDLTITSLGTGAATNPGKVSGVEMLGGPGPLRWTQNSDALVIQKPPNPPCDFAFGFKVRLS